MLTSTTTAEGRSDPSSPQRVVPNRPVLITGASGSLGRVLAAALSSAGWRLRLTDKQPFPDPLLDHVTFTQADLNDGDAISRLTEGCEAIVHMGGISVEEPFEEIMGPNLRGVYHVYEAARRAKARVIFASSSHAVGFHRRDESIGADTYFLPGTLAIDIIIFIIYLLTITGVLSDGIYGLSKAYGELMGRLYWYKHGVESVSIRIGSCATQPVNARALATWLSHRDLTQLVMRSVLAPHVGCVVIWGTSNNKAMTWWKNDAREQIGWTPQDSADRFRAEVENRFSNNWAEELYMGGAFCADFFTRDTPAPRDLFACDAGTDSPSRNTKARL